MTEIRVFANFGKDSMMVFVDDESCMLRYMLNNGAECVCVNDILIFVVNHKYDILGTNRRSLFSIFKFNQKKLMRFVNMRYANMNIHT